MALPRREEKWRNQTQIKASGRKEKRLWQGSHKNKGEEQHHILWQVGRAGEKIREAVEVTTQGSRWVEHSRAKICENGTRGRYYKGLRWGETYNEHFFKKKNGSTTAYWRGGGGPRGFAKRQQRGLSGVVTEHVQEGKKQIRVVWGDGKVAMMNRISGQFQYIGSMLVGHGGF